MKTLFQITHTPIAALAGRNHSLLIWATAAGLCLTSAAMAQDYALATTSAAGTTTSIPPANGYWKLTQAGADSTKVEFFKASNELLYATTLANQQVALTKKNVRKLNETLEHLTAEKRATTANGLLSKQYNLAGAAIPASELQIGTYASQDGINLHLMLDNPRRERAIIQIWNGREKVYEDFTYDDKQHYKFNMAEMPAGNYELRVVSKKQTLQRDVALNRPHTRPTMTVAVPETQIAIK